MTARFTRPAIQALPSIDHDTGPAERHLPVSFWLCGTVLTMNVLSTVLSLIA
jgi:hypothetical protein